MLTLTFCCFSMFIVFTPVSVLALLEHKVCRYSVKGHHDDAQDIRMKRSVVNNMIGVAGIIMVYEIFQTQVETRAKRVLLSDAMFTSRFPAGSCYKKRGGRARAEKDFSLIKVANQNNSFIDNYQWISSQGKVGNSIVQFYTAKGRPVIRLILGNGSSIRVTYIP